MSQDLYHFAGADGFVVEQYNDRAPFASFLPGIAGVAGRPAWVFYVSRGQAVASFGVRNKDGAFLEFHPADKAYRLTASRGFRTFLRITDANGTVAHEPFQRGAGDDVRQRLYVTPHEVGVEEIHPALGLRIRADVFTLPEAPLAGLVRRVQIDNTSSRAVRVEVVDGLPQVLSYGLNQWGVKFMSRTLEAYVRVEGVGEDLPFYRLKVWPTDTPQVEAVEGGHFFAGLCDGRHTRVLVDPERVFGLAADFSRPERFFAGEPLDFDQQVAGNQTPSAFQALTLELAPGQSGVFHGLYGHAPSREALAAFMRQAEQSGYLEERRELNRRLVEAITQRAFTATARPLFDAHVRQCYLDNGLRGGFPTAAPGGAQLHLYGRKHGDLERDYNDFLLADAPFSEGNGDFRDVLQNRRLDLFFDPALDARNIRYFFDLIQPDGYNPVSVRNTRFSVDAPRNLAHLFARLPGLEDLLSREFKYAELWQVLQCATDDPAAVVAEVLAQAEEVEDAEFDRGYWSDHWTYLVDLLVAYRAIYPDRLAGLLLDRTYRFFDPTHFVVPRSQKYVPTPRGVRQYGAVAAREDKIALIASRPQRRYRVRAQGGRGEVVTTTLLGKVLTLVANKLASLDPFGVGIEMEADRPGWCDALNGLPGLFGSSVNETIELKRLVDFTREVLAGLDGELALPVELADFVSGLDALLHRPALAPESFWRESGALKEAYREQVFMGFDGAERSVALAEATRFLARTSAHLDDAIARARTPDGIVTYFAHEAEDCREIVPGRVEVTRFRQRPLPLFLEGFVHALRVARPDEVRPLYDAVRRSALFDETLGMFRLNVPLGDDALDLGRIGVFNYGWLENGSIFLHMHYKLVLEMVRRGLLADFHGQIERLLVAFRDPAQYGRNPAECSSFLVSSGFAIDPRQHGRGCVARLSGATVELLHLCIHLFLGPAPFVLESGRLLFRPEPVLSKTFFTATEQRVDPFGTEEILPAGSAACALFGSTLLVYRNPTRRDCYGPDAVAPRRFLLYAQDGSTTAVEGACLASREAEALRLGHYRRIDVVLGD
jgi:hypothetical protein